MSHLHESVVRHFRSLFRRFATGFHEGEVCLTQPDLEQLLPRLGIATVGNANDLILQHDHSCVGILDFDDFLEFVASCERQVAAHLRQIEGVLRAFHHFEKKVTGSKFGRREFERVLIAGKRMPEEQIHNTLDMIFAANGTILDDSQVKKRLLDSMFWIESVPRPKFLEKQERIIKITVNQAYRLDSLLRPKVRPSGIQYVSLDGFVTVSLGDEVQETTVIVDNVTPEWNQTLLFQLQLPEELSEAEQRVKALQLTFSLHDHRPRGIVSHSEWLCSGSLPLSMLLSAGFHGKPVAYLLALHAPGILLPGQEQPLLEVSIEVDCDGITEHKEWEESKWLEDSASKILRDLIDLESGGDSCESSLPSPFYEHYVTTYKSLRSRFQRRWFQILAHDDQSVYRPICNYLQPLSPGASLGNEGSLEERLAGQVARIPVIDSAIPWSPVAATGFGIQESPLASPALMLLRRRGSSLDHAILLCSLFLGTGIDAYVCTGHAYGNQRHAWVVILEQQFDTPVRDAPTPTLKSSPSQENFRHAPYLARVTEKRRRFRARHYESTTGEWFSLTGHNVVGRRPGAAELGGGFGFPFERVACLANHRNIWINLQPSDVTPRTIWDLSDPADWQPFLTKEFVSIAKSPIGSSWGLPEFTPPDPIPRNPLYRKEFVSHIVDVIQGYRRHYLYIPSTYFHRPLCWAAQTMLQSDAPKYAAPGTNVVRMGDDDDGLLVKLRSKFSALTPPNYIWHARVFRFENPDAEAIVKQLAWTGILDNSIPSVVYFLGAEVVPLGWGLRSVWIIVGHLASI